jgi:hypothetical protein
MRLLNTRTLDFLESYEIPTYAILSHRWDEEEVTYNDVKHNRQSVLKGWSKITSFCALALFDGYEYAWVDACCINKDSSAELGESINSMYRWYKDAGACYAYFSDVTFEAMNPQGEFTFRNSAWFTRGWTLQELIAPLNVYFYNCKWQLIGSKLGLCGLVADITGISVDVLRHSLLPYECTIAHRMGDRRTTFDDVLLNLKPFSTYIDMAAPRGGGREGVSEGWRRG